jgi:hypothetical protein
MFFAANGMFLYHITVPGGENLLLPRRGCARFPAPRLACQASPRAIGRSMHFHSVWAAGT